MRRKLALALALALAALSAAATPPSRSTPSELLEGHAVPPPSRRHRATPAPDAGDGAGVTSRTPASPEALAHARTLVDAGGSADDADALLVAAELARLPARALALLEGQKTRVVACRGAITDFAADMKGKHPRGWPRGATYDMVPGIFLPDRNRVVIATVGHETREGPHVPRTGEGHGSVNLVFHESAHGLDLARGDPSSKKKAFAKARSGDLAALTDYEKQPGDGGPEETYAESFARYFEGERSAWPDLTRYWEGQALDDAAPSPGIVGALGTR